MELLTQVAQVLKMAKSSLQVFFSSKIPASTDVSLIEVGEKKINLSVTIQCLRYLPLPS